ncbi:MAG: hypothetical protein NG747_13360 [Candidatus Brocadia sp.]|nr:hypothetical protein [Candidatus Brocadia sp.]
MESILCLIAILYVLRSHFRTNMAIDIHDRKDTKHRVPTMPHKPLYPSIRQDDPESSWPQLIIIAIFLIALHFFV